MYFKSPVVKFNYIQAEERKGRWPLNLHMLFLPQFIYQVNGMKESLSKNLSIAVIGAGCQIAKITSLPSSSDVRVTLNGFFFFHLSLETSHVSSGLPYAREQISPYTVHQAGDAERLR